MQEPLTLDLTCAIILSFFQSSKAVSANAHFYVEIDYPKYMEYLAQVR